MRLVKLGNMQSTKILSAVAMVSILIVGCEILNLSTTRALQLRNASISVANLANSMATEASDTIELADFALTGVVQRLEINGTSPEALANLDRILIERRASQERFRYITVVAANGNTIARSGPPKVDGLSDREYFRHHKLDPSRGPFIGPPIKSRVTGQWSLTVSRRFQFPDGSSAGVVVAVIAVSYFTDYFNSFDLGSGGIIALYNLDGTLLARSPHDERMIAANFGQRELFTRLQTVAGDAYRGISVVDGVPRIRGYRKSTRYPVVIVAAQTETAALASWRASAWTQAEIVAALLSLIWLGGYYLALQATRIQAGIQLARKSEARFRQMVEGMPNASILVDANGAVAMVNAQAELLFGYDRSEMLGRPIATLATTETPLSRSSLPAYGIADPRSGMIGADRAVQGTRKDGSAFPAELALNEIDTDEGPMTLYAIGDITGRLDHEAKLQQVQRMEAIGQLTAGVAHDFNNLLQSITGSMEVIQARVANDPLAHDLVAASLKSAQRGARLASHLLSFSRQQVLRPAAVDLDDLLRRLAGTLKRALGPMIWIDVEVDPGLPPTLADGGHLDVALLNLALNARDAMPDGGTLTFKARESGGQIVIAVCDTGIGMPPEILARAQEPFFTTKGVAGSGLGLSMAQGFAQQSGGSLFILSEPNQGTRIELWLPVATTPAPSVSPVKAFHLHGTGRILVVDDSLSVRTIMEVFLNQAGFDVTVAADGEEAMHKMQTEPAFDGLVTDYLMPGINGAKLVSWARDAFVQLPALLVTGFGETDELEKLPADVTILRKPVQRSEFVSCVKAMVERRASFG